MCLPDTEYFFMPCFVDQHPSAYSERPSFALVFSSPLLNSFFHLTVVEDSRKKMNRRRRRGKRVS